ncbi:hydantoinase B/oxoprolinase family protein [Thiorhodococcus mannitoliphagus]|uniref:Hydantoinase B/oxoprolinase family protein n=1 Tax=Thiorhodococcus mannitoliphagus TaxID=329406 RepID=A0A6P1DMR2_9GAMM|nr:hydantoinase B/oxoprolinase family protein [Thiorhodococcus mannitoliphagus]NEX19328.1 hydantoinase B/oxoprolinase family protein [Thiorhodococcus mannitoliphagus]
MSLSPIDLALFASRMDAICEEMGVVLRQAAFSPNIRDRLDFSCAIFDPSGQLAAQAAHIPVHLGSMAFAMASIVSSLEWADGDMLVLNDPYLGGTHLPDVTLVAPLFVDAHLTAFVVNRAHHADIGASSPGSMPISRSLYDEGLIIPPSRLLRKGCLVDRKLDDILAATRNPQDARGDFLAQISANRAGVARLGQLAEGMGRAPLEAALGDLNAYGERLARAAMADIPKGLYRFEDVMDDDGQGACGIPIRVAMRVSESGVHLDFSGTASQVQGNINCPLAVTAAAVLYVFRCLMPPQTPACAGSFRPITLEAPLGCLVNACRPAAVAAGNVETSMRLVDVVMGALAQAIPERMPAASCGSMSNVAMGCVTPGAAWDYYETIGGGMGAGATGGGWSGVQTHMTNTLNTPIEVLEARLPLRVEHYGLREGSGGPGIRAGGEGILRELRFLGPAEATLLTERRRSRPWGSAGGEPGAGGLNRLNGAEIPAKTRLSLNPGDLLTIATPGGGGWGASGTPRS